MGLEPITYLGRRSFGNRVRCLGDETVTGNAVVKPKCLTTRAFDYHHGKIMNIQCIQIFYRKSMGQLLNYYAFNHLLTTIRSSRQGSHFLIDWEHR